MAMPPREHANNR